MPSSYQASKLQIKDFTNLRFVSEAFGFGEAGDGKLIKKIEEKTEQEEILEAYRSELVKREWLVAIYNPKSKRLEYSQTPNGLRALLAYRKMTDDLDNVEIPVDSAVAEDYIAEMIRDQAKMDQVVDWFKDEKIMLEHKDWSNNETIYVPTPYGHDLFNAMVFWISQKEQRKFERKKAFNKFKARVGKELANLPVNMVKASVKMADAQKKMEKFSGGGSKKSTKRTRSLKADIFGDDDRVIININNGVKKRKPKKKAKGYDWTEFGSNNPFGNNQDYSFGLT